MVRLCFPAFDITVVSPEQEGNQFPKPICDGPVVEICVADGFIPIYFCVWPCGISSGTPTMSVCLWMAGRSEFPKLTVYPDEEIVHIECGGKLFGVSIAEARLLFELEPDIHFHYVMQLPELGLVVIVGELGLDAIRPNGEELWSWDAGEIVTDLRLVDGRFEVTNWDNVRFIVDVATGAATQIS